VTRMTVQLNCGKRVYYCVRRKCVGVQGDGAWYSLVEQKQYRLKSTEELFDSRARFLRSPREPERWPYPIVTTTSSAGGPTTLQAKKSQQKAKVGAKSSCGSALGGSLPRREFCAKHCSPEAPANAGAVLDQNTSICEQFFSYLRLHASRVRGVDREFFVSISST
jgi:hypothetical protein